MQGSVVIIGNNKDIIKEKLTSVVGNLDNANNPDQLLTDVPENKKHIGIEEIRSIISFFKAKPLEHSRKIAVIYHSERMTTEAQNALLKLLEEPPSFADIVLLAKTEGALLPTILSRCQKIFATDKAPTGTDTFAYKLFIESPIGERFAWAEETSKEDKEIIVETLESWISEARQLVKKSPQTASTHYANTKLMLGVMADLENTNVNTRLALEYLATQLVEKAKSDTGRLKE